jgi:hypothetical protein
MSSGVAMGARRETKKVIRVSEILSQAADPQQRLWLIQGTPTNMNTL